MLILTSKDAVMLVLLPKRPRTCAAVPQDLAIVNCGLEEASFGTCISRIQKLVRGV